LSRRRNEQPKNRMIKLALFFLIVSIIAGVFGFTAVPIE
jgi:hypothetical protein